MNADNARKNVNDYRSSVVYKEALSIIETIVNPAILDSSNKGLLEVEVQLPELITQQSFHDICRELKLRGFKVHKFMIDLKMTLDWS